MENKLPTAKKILSKNIPVEPITTLYHYPSMERAMIEFGRLCAKYAQEKAAEKAEISINDKDINIIQSLTKYEDNNCVIYADKQSILNSFDLEEIK